MNIKDVREMVLINLKNVVRENISFMPVAFIDGPQTAVVGCPFTEESKVDILQRVGALARQMAATDLYIVTDSYLRVVDPAKEDTKWILEHWDIERPAMYPESLRKDCLVIHQMSFRDPSQNKVITILYEKKDGEVIITKEDETKEFKGLVKDSILEGYNE